MPLNGRGGTERVRDVVLQGCALVVVFCILQTPAYPQSSGLVLWDIVSGIRGISHNISSLLPPWGQKQTELQRLVTELSAPKRHVEDERKDIQPTPKIKICQTKACVLSAAEILSNMDAGVDPCSDFYQFACGSYIRRNTIPDDRSNINQFARLSEILRQELRALVEEPWTHKEPRTFLPVKNAYKSCMNISQIEKVGGDPILKLLHVIGGWPVLDGDDFDEESFNWINVIYKIRQTGMNIDYLFDVGIVEDPKETEHRIFLLDQPSLGMGRKCFARGKDDADVKVYLNFMTAIAVELGAERDEAEKELKDSLDFEINLSRILVSEEKRRNISQLYNKMAVRDMEQRWPSVPWLQYMNQIFRPHIRINNSEPILVATPSFFDKFVDLMAETPKRTLANYIGWRVVHESVPYVTERIRRHQLEYVAKLTGQVKRSPRWKECMGFVCGVFGNAIGALYVRKLFSPATKTQAADMVKHLRLEFDSVLDGLNWMDPVTKARAKKKATQMITHVAYPEELLDDRKLKSLYRGLTIHPNNFFLNVVKTGLYSFDYSLRHLRERVNKTDWISHGRAAVVNAFYSPLENSIQIPAGILHGVFFDAGRPKYLNYGGIGSVIGHEITHGFDDQGRQFDEKGNLVDWWLPETDARFREKAKCMEREYSNFLVPGNFTPPMKVNGRLTMGENIADCGGIKHAYNAYNRWLKKKQCLLNDKDYEEARLPGLTQYSPKQLFWIGAANLWCAKFRPESAKLQAMSDPHSPSAVRINGPFSNTELFAKDFNCKKGSRMNPVKKCAIW
ncbi:unnamed protein product [Cyprideis torosa]|uniref:Uncharacterized protein n=1 Tax=Cyprideis torosa TaxID=163714 RepID=A0A7R8ZQX9_9CRUS|nr:unnamed protein product [Cyprideis torosa]CAG0902422.1 unnamed protein product [Cyprideis torosa]